jgi:hypothetical protein
MQLQAHSSDHRYTYALVFVVWSEIDACSKRQVMAIFSQVKCRISFASRRGYETYSRSV